MEKDFRIERELLEKAKDELGRCAKNLIPLICT